MSYPMISHQNLVPQSLPSPRPRVRRSFWARLLRFGLPKPRPLSAMAPELVKAAGQGLLLRFQMEERAADHQAASGTGQGTGQCLLGCGKDREIDMRRTMTERSVHIHGETLRIQRTWTYDLHSLKQREKKRSSIILLHFWRERRTQQKAKSATRGSGEEETILQL